MMFYVNKFVGKKRYLFAGPFRTADEAKRVQKKLINKNHNDCPVQFIRVTNFDYGNGIFTVSKFSEPYPLSWFGDMRPKKEMKSITKVVKI